MATTHALAGLLLAVPVALVAPEFAVVAAVAGFAGGVFPDLDMPGEHRRTLHFPVYYTLAAGAVGVAALVVPSAWTVGSVMFLAAAAVHSLSDALGGDLELRPWEGTGDRGVYSHYHRRWWRPRRWVRYDGAPEDAVATVGLGLLALLAYDGAFDALVLGTIAVGVVYAALRRRIVDWGEQAVDALPEETVDRLPDTLVEDLR
ncbi:metal-dependent hydrolase [Halolamina sp. CBA1230]|uniref:metal-dependent hydrolase n=1 Tax=Halolamina sp. CBA1230 TaxID=1853690 RepID=UPI0020D1B3F1|nr:metal-dependent hydrolase [Halolamina sp. CBA1230]